MRNYIFTALFLLSSQTLLASTYYQEGKSPGDYLRQGNPYTENNPYQAKDLKKPYQNYGDAYTKNRAYDRPFPSSERDDKGNVLWKVNPQINDPNNMVNPYGQSGNPYNPQSSRNKPQIQVEINDPQGRSLKYHAPGDYSKDSTLNPYDFSPYDSDTPNHYYTR